MRPKTGVRTRDHLHDRRESIFGNELQISGMSSRFLCVEKTGLLQQHYFSLIYDAQ